MASTKTKYVNCLKCRKIIYENQNSICCDSCNHWVHLRCSGLKKKEFKVLCNNSTSTFTCLFCQNYKCGKCCKPVFNHHNALCCDNSDCKRWFHLKCTKVSLEKYKQFSNGSITDDWICIDCYLPPFDSFNNLEIHEFFGNTPLFNVDINLNHYDRKCPICIRDVHATKVHKSIPCKSCMRLTHRKCSGLLLKELNALVSKDLTHWECKVCIQDKFPFSNLEPGNLLKMAFNSNFDCICKEREHDFSENKEYILNYTTFSIDDDDSKFFEGPDPDNNIQKTYQINFKFGYYNFHSFHKAVKSFTENFKRTFSVFHTNIQSLSHNFENLFDLLASVDFKFDIIAVTETWNPDSKVTFSPGDLVGYTQYNGITGHTLKSGCGLYINSDLKYIDRKDLNISLYDDINEYQGKWIEIINTKCSNVLLAVYYRHPRKDSDKTFNENLNTLIQKIKTENKKIIITGDFNYDLLKLDKNQHIRDFMDTMLDNFLQPCITEPTRVVDGNKPSIVDNIFTNIIDKEIMSGNFLGKISDHMPNFIIIKDFIDKQSKQKRIVRDFKSFNQENYIGDIKNINIDDLKDANDVNTIYNEFHDKLVKTIDRHAPYKVLSRTELKWKRKPWLTPGIQKSIKTKNMLYGKYRRTKKAFWFNRYKLYRNLIKVLSTNSKQSFYKQYFENNMNNAKKIWSGINELLNKNTTKSHSQIFLNDNGVILTDQKKVANNFNKFYTNVAENLVQKLGNANNKFQDYLKNPNVHSIFLNEIEPEDVRMLISKIDTSKASDIYGISPKLIKIANNELYKNLTLIFNKSLNLGCFPDKLKTAKVIPIHKGDSKMECSNYRPISLLPILGKLLEKLMYERLINFFTNQNILSGKQYGFQKNKSTEQAILDLQANITEAFENKETPCCIFLDFAKAFDTVNHEILLSKLQHYGVRGPALNWLKSYLANRTQCVEIGDTISDFETVKNGVPQGSVLGPLLFLIYINDIENSSEILKFFLFADDTSLFFSHRNTNMIETVMNNELKSVSNWLIANKLSLNVKKSNVLLFRNKNDSNDLKINLVIDNKPLQEKNYAKYLGLLIDNKLTFSNQIEHIRDKIIKGNAILYKLRNFVPGNILINLYNAHIQPHLDYGALVWGRCAQSHINRLSSQQNKSIRIMNFKKYSDPTTNAELFRAKNLLPVEKNINYLECRFIWKILNKPHLVPTSIIEIFEKHGSLTVRDDTTKLHLPFRRTTHGQRYITFSGIQQWKTLPKSISSTITPKYFNKSLKVHLLNSIE